MENLRAPQLRHILPEATPFTNSHKCGALCSASMQLVIHHSAYATET